MFTVCNASVSLADLELESLFWPARRQRYKQFLGQSPASRRQSSTMHNALAGGDAGDCPKTQETSMFAVCNASVPLAELELESLFWPARRQRYKEFLDSLAGATKPFPRNEILQKHVLQCTRSS